MTPLQYIALVVAEKCADLSTALVSIPVRVEDIKQRKAIGDNTDYKGDAALAMKELEFYLEILLAQISEHDPQNVRITLLRQREDFLSIVRGTPFSYAGLAGLAGRLGGLSARVGRHWNPGLPNAERLASAILQLWHAMASHSEVMFQFSLIPEYANSENERRVRAAQGMKDAGRVMMSGNIGQATMDSLKQIYLLRE